MGLPRAAGKSYEGDNDYELKFVRLTENPYRKYADANIRRALEEYGGSKIKTQKAAATSDCNKGAVGKRKREATCNLQLEKPPKEDLYSSSSTSIDSGHIADESSSSETYTHRNHKLKRISNHTSARPLSRSESDSDHRETDEHVKTSLTAEGSCSSAQYSGTVKKHRKVSASVSTHPHKPTPPKRKTRSKKSLPKLPSKGSTPVHPSNEVSSKPPSKKSKVLAAAKKIYEEHGMAGLEPVIYVTILVTAQMKGISFEEASGLYFCRQNGPKKKCKKRAMRFSRIVYRPVSRKLNRNKVSKKVRNSTVAAEESGTARAELVYSHMPISLRHYVSPSSSLVGLRSRSTESKFFSGEDVRCPAVEIPQPPASSDRIFPQVSADGAASNAPHTETETRQTQLAELPTARTPPAAVKGKPKSQVVISAPPPQAWNEKLEVCSKLLHAHDYGTIVTLFPRAPAEDVALIFIYSLALLKLGKFSDAKRSFLSCERTANAAGRQSDVALCCVYLGDLELSDQNYDQAGGCYRRAIQYHSVNSVASQFKMVPPSLSSINSKLGSCLRNSSKPVEAIQAYKEAVSDAQTDKDKLSACTSLGNLFQSLGENTQALEQYQQSIDLAVGLEDNVSLGWAHGNMGNAYLGLFQKEKALHHLKQSLDLTVQYEPVPQAIGRAYNNLGTAYQSLGDLDEAEVQYDLALSQAIYGNDIPGQARVYGNIGNVFMLRKEYERAVPHYTEVLRLSRDRSTITTAHHNRGCAYYEWGEHKKKALYGSPFDDDDETTDVENRPPNTKKVAANNNPSSFLRRCEADYDSITSLDDLEPTGKDSSPQAKPSEGANKKVECHYYLHGPDFEHNVEDKHRPHVLVDSVAKYFKHGSGDLEEVITQNEASFKNIKGSSKGFSLSVSLFESNSRTFHRKQDCLVNIGEWKEALAIAEQSRARTLGELMLRKKALVIDHPLTSPLDLAQIEFIVSQQDCPVVYLSYTGARLLCWVLLPLEGKVRMNMFEVPLKDNHFEGKSFDYHLRYNLTETLVERSFEMYRNFRYEEEEQIRPVQDLYDLVAIPLLRILEKFDYKPTSSPKRIVLIPDSYTMLLPFTCLLHDKSFLGDSYYFQIVPSLLSMGILSQLEDVVVRLPDDSRSMCVVGNPSIPSFAYNGEEWNLGKLPHAAREAKWVGHILKTAPILDEQATKNAVLMRIMNAKVIHIATHGSASAGFLAFAGLTSSQRNKDIVDSKAVLLYPDEVEKLTISPALVVLSSCDSGRGTVKADGIQGMARAFILAGAQAVLTTLWRVPDESASVFMKLFYQFLVEGFPSSESLQKAILTLRCFSKYSQYIHWSGFQITGRDIRFEVPESVSKPTLDKRLGPSSVFPRLEEVQQFESALVRNPCLPTDVQVLRASPGIKPSEIIIDFLHYNHDAFKGGIFWINGRRPELIEASILYIEQVGIIINVCISVCKICVYYEYFYSFRLWMEILLTSSSLKPVKQCLCWTPLRGCRHTKHSFSS